MDREENKIYSNKHDESNHLDEGKLHNSSDDSVENEQNGSESNINDSCNEKLLYLAAELQNTRNRMLKDIESARFSAIRNFALDMCEVADNMKRAKQYIKQGSGSDSVLQGIDMILNSLSGIFGRHGINSVETLNKKFDPSLHEAISEEERLDLSAGYILREVQGGYILDGKLLRPAKVIVSRG